jgi:hypothetical protein
MHAAAPAGNQPQAPPGYPQMGPAAPHGGGPTTSSGWGAPPPPGAKQQEGGPQDGKPQVALAMEAVAAAADVSGEWHGLLAPLPGRRRQRGSGGRAFPPAATVPAPPPPAGPSPHQQPPYGAAAYPGSGAPPPMGIGMPMMPPMMPMRPGPMDPESQQMEADMAFASVKMRNGFARKVLGIVTLQLIVTAGVAAACMFVPEVKRVVRAYPSM